MENIKKSGSISVDTAHIFPVIKKWLYSEKEIFLRELVSNACDAVTKLRRLESLGELSLPAEEHFAITVSLDKQAKTLTVSDNGIGMTGEELEKYICSIALSGAMDFMEKYEQNTDGSGIIGHFGLGFYSAFMVADRVRVLTRSFKEGAQTVNWLCEEGGEYSFEEEETRARGTDVILYLNEEGEEYLDGEKLKAILEKYCSFMPVDIYFEESGEERKEQEDEKKPINDKNPLWLTPPSQCQKEDYDAFYKKVFADYKEPLFHIHINADYPLNFKGILYFPRMGSEYENMEGQVKLYYNQVFVADNIGEVIPEYFLMLKGVLDCPELPLNVSRSYLQNSGYVSKISAHIVKKTADKLCGIFNTERSHFEELWQDIKLFVEYGSLKDRKFYDRVKDILLLPLSDGRYLTLKEYLEEIKEQAEGKIYYATDKVTQAQYIALYTGQGLPVAIFDKILDTQFMSMLESLEGVKFYRVDAELADALKKEDGKEDETLKGLFASVCPAGTEVSFTALKEEGVPAILNISEEERRMNDMMKMYGMELPDLPQKQKLILNTASPLLEKLRTCADQEKKKAAAGQIYGLALLSQRQLTAEELRSFLSESFKTLELGL